MGCLHAWIQQPYQLGIGNFFPETIKYCLYNMQKLVTQLVHAAIMVPAREFAERLKFTSAERNAYCCKRKQSRILSNHIVEYMCDSK